MDVTVVVLCYDRLDLLERTLRALLSQQAPTGIAWEIVVADNHADAPARALVERLSAASTVALRHVHATPARNIALARNRGVAAARGRLVGFVDDDEAPAPGWLTEHCACLARTGADASFGPKHPEFEGGAAPVWDPDGTLYTVDFHMPADADIRPLDWRQSRGRGLGTGNSMLRRDTCLVAEKPFNEAFGCDGGEDTLLFFGLARQGRRFVWCPTAVVTEFNRAERLTTAYMANRLGRSARHSATCRMAVTDNRVVTGLGIAAVGLGQVVTHAALHVLSGAFRDPTRQRHRFGMRKGLGKLGLLRALDYVGESRASAPAGTP